MKNLSVLDQTLRVETCKHYIKNEYAHVRVRIDGSTFMRHTAGLSYSTSDKFGLIGGTLGMFSGFSMLFFFEIIHWLGIGMLRVFYPGAASVEPEDSQEERIKNVEEENQELKKQMLEMKKQILAIEGVLKNKPAEQEPATVVNVEEN